MIQINLLPDIVLQRRKDARIRKLAQTALVAWAVVIGVLLAGAFGYQVYETTSLNSATSKYVKLNAVVNSKENVAFRTEAIEVQSSLESLDDLYNKQQKFSVINARLASITPKTVTLTDVNIDDASKIRISAKATSYLEAAKFVAALKETAVNPDAKEITFGSITFDGATLGDKSVNFSIVATYTYPDPMMEAN